MKRLAAMVLVLSAELALGSFRAESAPLVRRDVKSYEVVGTTPEEVRASLDNVSPKDGAGRRTDSITYWQVRWHFRFGRENRQCIFTLVTVSVDTTIHVPRLRNTPETPVALSRAFQRHVEKLVLHETAYVQAAVEAARRIEAGMQALEPEIDCEGLARRANALGQSILDEAKQKDGAMRDRQAGMPELRFR